MRIRAFLTQRLKRSQRGQSILLLAFAFVALLAFVGLVTDVSLLFVRYASLRRAVDAAAIAAAGQIREGSNYSNVAMAAEQYINLHNLDASSVLVETCETDIYQWRAGLGPWQGVPHPESNSQWNPVNEKMPTTELCDWADPHKLVRVSAQIESPTTFLSLLGIGSITLEATSVSETALLDVALVIDTSESMSKETTLLHYQQVGVTLPADTGALGIRGECYTNPSDPKFPHERWGGCCNDPGTGYVGDGSLQSNGVVLPNGLIWHDTNGNGMYDGGGEKGLASTVPMTNRGVPWYNNPDAWNFTTLICRPFKDVKDAARLFIKRLDFVRGDRVVLVTFNRVGIAYDPDGAGTAFRPMIRSESVAIDTLNQKMGVMINSTRVWNRCGELTDAYDGWVTWQSNGSTPPPPTVRPYAYESIASCGNTNVGGGILAASNALTDPVDVRREAVWVMIVLSDGAANVTNSANNASSPQQYGFWGYCPWWTFCFLDSSNPFHWPECTENNPSQTELQRPICNDNDPITRYFCIDWSTGEPETGNTACVDRYDADDYARDMADFAGLIEVIPGGKQGNFIAMFSIGFGDEVRTEPTAAPLLRYIADAGDNGFIDNNLQQDLREDRNPVPTYPIGGPYPPTYGDPGPCEGVTDPTEQCGQYYYATDLASLDTVFEEIASRLFTRLSR